MALSQDQYLLLSQMAYLDIEQACGNRKNASIQDIYQYFRQNPEALQGCSGSISADQMMQVLRVAADDPDLGGYKLVSYVNNNPTRSNPDGSGLVSYAFESADGKDRVFSFRGSEGGMFPGDSVDWADNMGLATSGDSRQMREAIEFVENLSQNKDVNYSSTGHSLGGSHAMVIAGVFGFDGAAFDARGVPPAIENSKFWKTYNNSGFDSFNMQGDMVSSLKKFVKRPKNDTTVTGEGFFDDNGQWRELPSKSEAARLKLLYSRAEKLIYKCPSARLLIADLYRNGITEINSLSDFLQTLKQLGYSAGTIAELALYWRDVGAVVALGLANNLEYIANTHYTQAFPNASIDADNARCEFAFKHSHMLKNAGSYKQASNELASLEERIIRLAKDIEASSTSTHGLARSLRTVASNLQQSQQSIHSQGELIEKASELYNRTDSNVEQLFQNLGF